ncbi:MAG: DUF3592 domain-containing protein [Usitatibacter sp.]
MSWRSRVERRLATPLLLVGGIAFGIAAVVAQQTLDEARALARYGVQTTGTVTQAHLGGKRNTRHYIGYRYVVAGKDLSKGGEVTEEAFSELTVGVSLPVRFDPDDPHRAISGPELARIESLWTRVGFSASSAMLLVIFGVRMWNWIRAKASSPKPRKPRDSQRKC